VVGHRTAVDTTRIAASSHATCKACRATPSLSAAMALAAMVSSAPRTTAMSLIIEASMAATERPSGSHADRGGRIQHDGGAVCGAPGVYLLGMPFLRRRRTSFINGADHDTAALTV
jgi:hypothetical protein